MYFMHSCKPLHWCSYIYSEKKKLFRTMEDNSALWGYRCVSFHYPLFYHPVAEPILIKWFTKCDNLFGNCTSESALEVNIKNYSCLWRTTLCVMILCFLLLLFASCWGSVSGPIIYKSNTFSLFKLKYIWGKYHGLLSTMEDCYVYH